MVTKKLAPQKRSGKAKNVKNNGPQRKKPSRKKQAARRISPWLVAAVIALLGILILIPYIREGKLASTGATVPADARKFCLDISHYNTGIVWDSLLVAVDKNGRTSKDILKARKVFPVSAVIIKATEGEKLLDSRFKEYWEEAGNRHLSRGAYHFFRSSKNPVRQAEQYMAHVQLRHSDLPPVLDVETMHKGITSQELSENVLAWLRIIEKHYGRKPIVYTSDSYARDILSPEITRNYPLWIARYNPQPPRFEDWTMWQFTDKAVVHGVSGYVDLSVIK